jgi:hypothetical protein
MRKCATILFLFLLFSFVIGQNILPNNDFEDWTVNGVTGPPDNWTLSSTGITAAQENTTVQNGAYSVNLSWTNTATVYLDQTVAINPSTDYYYQVYFYDNDPNGRARIWFTWLQSDLSFISSGGPSTYTSDQASWQMQSYTATAPVNAAYLRVDLRVYDESGWSGSATIFADDSWLNEGTDYSLPIQLTSFTARAGDRIVTLRWVTQSEKDNVGFEIMRSNQEDGNYDLLSSYVNNEALKGQLNSSKQTVYKFVDKLVGNDITYWYKLVDVDLNGVKTFHGPLSATPHAVGNEIVNTTPGNLPKEFALQQNYPNPFNPNTTLSFDIPQLSSGNVDATLYIYNALGQQVKVLYQGKIAAGTYTVEWNGTSESGLPLPSGIYYAILKADYFVKTIKMMYLK